MVNDLPCYITGGPISDHRITAADEELGTFMAREGTRVADKRNQVPVTLSIQEFISRWSLHVLPEQLTRTRYFGGWGNNQSASYLAQCEKILRRLGRIEENDDADTSIDTELISQAQPEKESSPTCLHCGSAALELLIETLKPSWRDVFCRESETSPPSYAVL